MRTGECDFAQQGCLYKHEMPTSSAVLLSLGFRHIPEWYLPQKRAANSARKTTKAMSGNIPNQTLPCITSDSKHANGGMNTPLTLKSDLPMHQPISNDFHRYFEHKQQSDLVDEKTTLPAQNHLSWSKFAPAAIINKHQTSKLESNDLSELAKPKQEDIGDTDLLVDFRDPSPAPVNSETISLPTQTKGAEGRPAMMSPMVPIQNQLISRKLKAKVNKKMTAKDKFDVSGI
jgi:hypothetical protein